MNLDTIKEELLSIADTSLKYATNKLPDAEIEVYLTQNSKINVDINGGTVIARDSVYSGSAIRVFNERKKAFACTSGIGLDNVKEAIDEAINISKSISFVDDRFKSLYEGNANKVSKEGIIDPELLELQSKSIGDDTYKILQECKTDERIISMMGFRSVTSGAYAVVNTSGIGSASRYTVNGGSVRVVAKEGNKQKSSYDYCLSRTAKDFDLEEVALSATKEVLTLLGSKELHKSDVIPIVWDPVTASQYIRTALNLSITGKGVVEGDSYFADKIADEVATKELSVIDDGQLSEAPSTNAIDEEGAPCQKTPIIEKGVLKSYITDSYYGNLMDMHSTGNSKRLGNPTYEGLPGISTNTLVVTPTNNKSLDKFIQDIDYGVYIKGALLGMLHTNQITGEMSVVSPSAYLIEKGELKHALEPLSIAGNVYKSLKNISAIGSDSKLTPFGVKTPTLRIDGLTVTG